MNVTINQLSPSRHCKPAMNYMDLKFYAWKHFPKFELPLMKSSTKKPAPKFCICTHWTVKIYTRLVFALRRADSTGLPHILEHSVLAGSEKYPLKDVFKELMRSTLQTFINAFTYPDKTIYPVASQIKADFFNLARVYTDLVLHPRMLKETFLAGRPSS